MHRMRACVIGMARAAVDGFSAEEPPGRGTDEDGPLSAPLGPLGAWTTDILSRTKVTKVWKYAI